MSLPIFQYHLHDSVLLSTDFEYVGRLIVKIRLYKIYYPEESIVKLIISGIANTKEIETFHQEVVKQSGKKGWLGYRIDEFDYNADHHAKTGLIQLRFSVDHFEPLFVQCRKCHFTKSEH